MHDHANNLSWVFPGMLASREWALGQTRQQQLELTVSMVCTFGSPLGSPVNRHLIITFATATRVAKQIPDHVPITCGKVTTTHRTAPTSTSWGHNLRCVSQQAHLCPLLALQSLLYCSATPSERWAWQASGNRSSPVMR